MVHKLFFLFTLVFGAFCAETAMAQDTLTIANVNYKVFPEKHTAFVIAKDGGYSGSVNIPKHITVDYEPFKVIAIESGTFKDCKALKDVVITSSIEMILPEAFVNVPEGVKLYINSSGVPLERNAFDESCFKNITLCLPTERILNTVTRKAPWSKFVKTGLVPKEKSDGVDRRSAIEKMKDNSRLKKSSRSKTITY